MAWQAMDRSELEQAMNYAVLKANGKLARKNRGHGYARVTAIVVEEIYFDGDDIVATGEVARRKYEYDSIWTTTDFNSDWF